MKLPLGCKAGRGGRLARALVALIAVLTLASASIGFAGDPPSAVVHWAFRAPVAATVPRVTDPALARWVRNPIDAFVAARMERDRVRPAVEADRRTLIRRAAFTLVGLPPTPEAVQAFVADRSPDAYEKVVDALLASPQYGERWAQHWLDVVRFAETNGFELDQDRPQAWRYRDYVVNALNEDRRYDRFLTEQIAGDELDPESFEMSVATGFLRAGPRHVVAGNLDPAVIRQEWLTEAVAGVGAVMGLTIGCARCHDHKFDPLPQRDYYRLEAFFAASDSLDQPRHTPAEKATYGEVLQAHKARLEPLSKQISTIEQPYRARLRDAKRARLEPSYREALDTPDEKRTAEQKRMASEAQVQLNVMWDEVLAVLTPEDRERRARLRRQFHTLELGEPEALRIAPCVAEVLKPAPPTFVLLRGDAHVRGEEVAPGFPIALGGGEAALAAPKAEAPTAGRRLALARWLTRPDHPLTARVMVNRVWQQHFGRGLVATPNDFGRHGSLPVDALLLDWLSRRFTAETQRTQRRTGEGNGVGAGFGRNLLEAPPERMGWSLKRLHRLIVLSATYRQAANGQPVRPGSPTKKLRVLSAPSASRRLNSGPEVRRLDAEALRDSVLAVAGSLNGERGGASVRAPLEPEVYDTIFSEAEPDNLWPVHPDPKQHVRRSLYLLRKRNVRLPMLAVFDQPDMMTSCGARLQSVHALQALTLMNSDFMRAQSETFARRLLREAPESEARRIDRLFRLALSRPPRPKELEATQRFLREQTALLRAALSRGEVISAMPDAPAGVDAANAAAWADLCLATFNRNDFAYLD